MKFYIYFLFILTFSLPVTSNGDEKLKCWQCTWDRDYKEDVSRIPDAKPTEKVEDEINNPSVEPFLGKESWEEPADKNILWKKCKNCTDGDACITWNFRLMGSESPIKNVTRMCAVTTAKSGCYRENMGNGWQKEVCFCRKNNCNGRAALSLPNFSLIIIILLAGKLIAGG
ncbi:uncharacterized protein LOC111624639 [Centruroides sculpturatus]|uniref:uncharacterized protein LOC111624639 n=1 Tax=Centruroides sculpturatus TaxID=218467 RepID=UPI000C6D91C7|nr:uncharacterized protein LOC111624639 [Centruroides sculpturatus]